VRLTWHHQGIHPEHGQAFRLHQSPQPASYWALPTPLNRNTVKHLSLTTVTCSHILLLLTINSKINNPINRENLTSNIKLKCGLNHTTKKWAGPIALEFWPKWRSNSVPNLWFQNLDFGTKFVDRGKMGSGGQNNSVKLSSDPEPDHHQNLTGWSSESDPTSVAGRWHSTPLNSLNRMHKCDEQQRDHTTKKCVDSNSAQ